MSARKQLGKNKIALGFLLSRTRSSDQVQVNMFAGDGSPAGYEMLLDVADFSSLCAPHGGVEGRPLVVMAGSATGFMLFRTHFINRGR